MSGLPTGDHVLDVARVDVEAARDDHVLGAVDDAQEAVGIAHGNVAGMQPAALEGFGGQLGIAVAVHHQRPLHDDFARLSIGYRIAVAVVQFEADPGARQPAAGKPVQVVRIMVRLAHVADHHRCFRLPVELREDRADALDRFLEPRRADRGGAVEDRFQTGEVELVEARVIEQGIDHRRHQHHAVDAVRLDHFHDLHRIEARQDQERAAAQQRGHEHCPASMRQGRAGEDVGLFGPFPHGLHVEPGEEA